MPRTVLVADDSPTIQNKAKGILTGEGLEVVTVSNGVAAIKKLPQVKPQIILADVSMPGRDGYEVCDFVKNSPDLCHIPVVLIFSDVDPYNEEQGTRVRADGKIRKMAAGKPFVPEELISTVAGFLAQAEVSAAEARLGAGPARPSELVTEPVDEQPQVRARKNVEVGSLPQGVAFGEDAVDAAPPPGFESAPPSSESAMENPVGAEPAEEEHTEESGHEPVLVEETPAEETPSVPRVERTMIFRTPAEIAEPLLNDELTSPPPAAAPPARGSATTLGSFSLSEATTGEVRFASPEAETEPSYESNATPPETSHDAEVAASGPPVDTNLVHSIVQKVVAKMSPPALSQEVIDEMARKLAGEIIAELISESS